MYTSISKSLITIAWFSAAATFALSMGIFKGYQPATAVIFLVSLFFIFHARWKELNKDDKKMFYVFLAYSLSFFVFVFLDDYSIEHFDKPSRFLFVLPVFFMLLNYKGAIHWLWYGVALGGLFAFALAVYEKFYLNHLRASGAEHPIMFGNTSMMLGLLSFTAVAFFYAQKRYIWMFLSALGAVCGIGASFLSLSRGGWVALPLIVLFILWQNKGLFSKKIINSIVIVFFALLLLVVLIPQTKVLWRVDQAIGDVVNYEAGHKDSSLGLRFEMWKTAFYMFEESPLIGVGKEHSEVLRHKYVEEGLVHPKVDNFDHAHNEYFDTLALRGIIGFFFLMLVYLVPLKLFVKKLKQYPNDWNIRPYAIAGAVIPMSYMDFALSQSMFSHNTGVMMYAFPIVYFWAALRWAEKERQGS